MAHLVYKDRSIDLKDPCVIGRQKGNCVVVLDEKASREHCRIRREGETWHIEDLGSANGTRINGVIIDGPTRLRHGDRIGISSVIISFLDAGPLPAEGLDSQRWDRKALIGTLLGGNRLQKTLGSGTLATVFQARQINLNRTVAVKVFHPGLLKSNPLLAEEINRTTREAGRVNDPGIAAIHECGNENGLLWYSMEFVDGEPLAALLERDEHLVWDLAVVIAERVARAVAKAHAQGLVHQGLSPKNVMLSGDGRVKVLELGMAGLLQKQQHLFKAERSQHHLAPEQLQGHEPEPATDVYAIGCLLFHLIAGQPPFAGADDVAAAHIQGPLPRIRRYASDCPEAIDRLLRHLLAKEPADRPNNLIGLADGLRDIRHEHGGQESGAGSSGGGETGGGRGSGGDTRRDSDIAQRQRLADVEEHRSARQRPAGVHHGALFALIAIAAIVIGVVYIGQHRPPEPLPPEAEPPPPPPPPPLPPIVERPPEPSPQEQQADGQRAAWNALRMAVEDWCGEYRWSEAERAVLRYRQEVSDDPDLVNAADSLLEQVRLDARLWYDDLIAVLPQGDDPATLRALLDRLTAVRRQVLPAQLADVAGRMRSAMRRLEQHLAVARRRATQWLEEGRIEELPALVEGLPELYRDTRLEPSAETFAARAREAAAIPWLGEWGPTRAALAGAQGEAALAAAAACFLTSDDETATDLLLSISDPALRDRRDRLIGSSAIHIAFADLNALARFAIRSGNPTLADGSLLGHDGQATEIVSHDRLRGRIWECRSTLTLPLEAEAELIVAIGDDDEDAITVRLNDGGVFARLSDASAHRTATHDLPPQPIDLRIRHEGGRIAITVNGASVLDSPATVPDSVTFRLTATGRGWRLHELHLIGIGGGP